MTDRDFGLAVSTLGLKVRRLMYQLLIWPAVLSDNASGLGSTFDSKDLKRLADSLVDRVRRDSQLGGDFFGRQMLIDKTKAIELPGA